jgi:hypothetical protein
MKLKIVDCMLCDRYYIMYTNKITVSMILKKGEASHLVQFSEYVCGMTWGWTGKRGTWTTKEAERSMELMAELGVNWAVISFSALQNHPQATEIKYWEQPTVTDDEIGFAIRKAKQLGMKVCLKPVVNCADGTWRAHINFFDHDVPGEPAWSEWFASYNRFILHYAAIAEEMECELLCIGCEMVQTDKREEEWRSLIREVRQVYTKWITYTVTSIKRIVFLGGMLWM